MRQTRIVSSAPARPAARPRNGAERGRTPCDTLRGLSSDLDELIRDVTLGAKSHRQHEDHVDRAEGIAAGLRAVFRGAEPPVNPPLLHRGGRAWW